MSVYKEPIPYIFDVKRSVTQLTHSKGETYINWKYIHKKKTHISVPMRVCVKGVRGTTPCSSMSSEALPKCLTYPQFFV